MSTKWEDKYVKCPFYCKSNPGGIVCEGFQDGSRINVTFQNRADKISFMKHQCESIANCKRCPIHELLERLYDGE